MRWGSICRRKLRIAKRVRSAKEPGRKMDALDAGVVCVVGGLTIFVFLLLAQEFTKWKGDIC